MEMPRLKKNSEFKISAGNGVRYTIPNSYFKTDGTLNILFRVTKKFTKTLIIETLLSILELLINKIVFFVLIEINRCIHKCWNCQKLIDEGEISPN